MNLREKWIGSSKEYNVLVVEDSSTYRMLLVNHLDVEREFTGRIKYTIKSFRNAEECLENIATPPDVLVVDHHLNPNHGQAMNGLDLVKRIKNLYPSCSAVVVSCQKDLRVLRRFMQAGVNKYILKSDVAPRHLRTTVHALLKQKQRLKKRKNIGVMLGIIVLISLIIFNN